MNRVIGEIETARPLHAPDGVVSLAGWCLVTGRNEPPEVRLVTAKGILAMTDRTGRPDVAGRLQDEPAAAASGFVINGRLPAGVYLARFEARLPEGTWHCFKSLSLAVEPPRLLAGVELPGPGDTVRKRVHVEGWVLKPDQPVQELTLRYGHQEISCETGRARPDLVAMYPGSSHAARAGFKSRTILSAGRGRLRLKARLTDGQVAIARTALEIAVSTDENHGPELQLDADRVGLPTAPTPAAPPAAEPAGRPLNVLFILHGSFAANSALHVTALANELAAAGHACTVAVTHDLATLDRYRSPRFRGILHAEAAGGIGFANGRGPDVIHAWTTREPVRQLAVRLRQRQPGTKVVVHLEDNELQILALRLGRAAEELATLSEAELDALIPGDLSHPRRSRGFLAGADGVTVITEKLRELAPAGRPCHLLWPAADTRFFHPRPLPVAFRRVLDRTPGETVLFYHGNVHPANAAEVRELYTAVLRLNQNGTPVTLIRTGADIVDFMGELGPQVAPHVLHLGQILHHHHLPGLMALADIFVQPGAPDAFNDYRFPSKLPEFFSLGRPVILPRTNLGGLVRHGEDAYVLERADATGIARAVVALRTDAALAAHLAKGAAAYAERNFSWRRSAAELAKFYARLAT